uniref:Uncharacterized protein n=1 Tax=Arundo donax TaxID=35708 RepID=A0A0A9E9T6_ARUDO
MAETLDEPPTLPSSPGAASAESELAASRPTD